MSPEPRFYNACNINYDIDKLFPITSGVTSYVLSALLYLFVAVKCVYLPSLFLFFEVWEMVSGVSGEPFMMLSLLVFCLDSSSSSSTSIG